MKLWKKSIESQAYLYVFDYGKVYRLSRFIKLFFFQQIRKRSSDKMYLSDII